MGPDRSSADRLPSRILTTSRIVGLSHGSSSVQRRESCRHVSLLVGVLRSAASYAGLLWARRIMRGGLTEPSVVTTRCTARFVGSNPSSSPCSSPRSSTFVLRAKEFAEVSGETRTRTRGRGARALWRGCAGQLTVLAVSIAPRGLPRKSKPEGSSQQRRESGNTGDGSPQGARRGDSPLKSSIFTSRIDLKRLGQRGPWEGRLYIRCRRVSARMKQLRCLTAGRARSHIGEEEQQRLPLQLQMFTEPHHPCDVPP